MKEKNWIRYLQTHFNPSLGLTGIGDDAALLGKSRNTKVITIDTLCENTHFLPSTKAFLIGKKSVNVSLSDCAAMGAIPKHMLISLGMPANTKDGWIFELYRGIESALKMFGVTLIGGDTVRSKAIVISSVGIGEIRQKHTCISRKGAREGDGIYATGHFGYSLKTGHHLDFTPRVKEMQWLQDHIKMHSATDASDGLNRSIELLITEDLHAHIDLENINVREVDKPDLSDIEHALFDGEDFELVFTARNISSRMLKTFEHKFQVPLIKIGEIKKGKRGQTITYMKNHKRVYFKAKPFEHFDND